MEVFARAVHVEHLQMRLRLVRLGLCRYHCDCCLHHSDCRGAYTGPTSVAVGIARPHKATTSQNAKFRARQGI